MDWSSGRNGAWLWARECRRTAHRAQRTPLGFLNYPIHPARQRHNVDIAVRVLTERADVAPRRQLRRPVLLLFRRAAGKAEAFHEAGTVVRIEIQSRKRRDAGAPVDVAAGDGACPTAVVILEHRQCESRGGAAG